MSTSINNSENELIAIHQKLNEQSQQLNELRRALASMRSNGNGHPLIEAVESTALTDRRGMLKKVAGLAAGVATVGLLRPNESAAAKVIRTHAPSLNGDPWVVGVPNDAQNPTGLENSTTTLASTQLNIRNFSSADFSQPSGTNIAIVGYTNPTGGPANTNHMIGLWGEAHGGNTNIAGMFVADDTGIVIQAGRATLCLFSTDEVFPPTSANSHTLGEVVVDQDYTLWYSIVAANPPSIPKTIFRRLAGPTGGTGATALRATAGALSAFDASSRFVDTRTASGNPYQGQHLAAGATAGYQISGETFSGNTVPTGATGIIARIANPNQASGSHGSILVAGQNPPPAGTGVIGLATALVQNQFFFSALDSAGMVFVKNGTTGQTDIIIDVVGYYL